MDKRSSKLNEGPLLRRLLETLGMVEIPQVTLPSPPKRKKMKEIKANNGNLYVCMSPTQKQNT